MTIIPIEHPLEIEEIEARLDADGKITGVVRVSHDEIVRWNIEELDDGLSWRLIGSSMGTDIGYELVGLDGQTLLYEVTLDPSIYLGRD